MATAHGTSVTMVDIAKVLKKEYGAKGYNVPTKAMPNGLLK
jgi:hypothetical protein